MLSFLTGSSGVDSRKTITFGDAAAVRSNPRWSLLSLLLLIALWWLATATFGFPEDFKAEAEAAAEADGETLTQAQLVGPMRPGRQLLRRRLHPAAQSPPIPITR